MWIVPNAQKNMMEPIIIHLEQGGSWELKTPHEGEEFGMCFLEVFYFRVNENTSRQLAVGECFYYKPNSITIYLMLAKEKPSVCGYLPH